MKKLFIIPLLFFTFFVDAQVQDIKIRVFGEVVDLETMEPVPFVHIINSTTNQGLTTNSQGKFDFTINRMDTLIFSSVSYEKYYLNINDDNSELDTKYIKIALKPSTTELKEVEVFAYKDMESFKKDFLALELPEKQEKISVPGSYDGPRREIKPSILSPVSYVYSLFDKKAKERAKLADVQLETEQWNQLRKKYDFIKEIAEVKDEELEEFLEYCNLDIRKIEASTEYELALAVNRCLPDYKSSKNQ